MIWAFRPLTSHEASAKASDTPKDNIFVESVPETVLTISMLQ
jgi:hypothetical protein